MSFEIQWKKGWFWKSIKNCTGLKLEKDSDRLLIYHGNGEIYELSQWSKCDIKLGEDHFNWNHQRMEREAAQAIPVNKQGE